MEKFGFIILRHISISEHDNYWRECVKCIRKFHNEKIVVIDDNSKINVSNDINYNNIIFAQSEYKGAGEILGYHYAYKYKLFETFIVLHDSMFLNYKLPKINQSIIFLWHFSKYLRKNKANRNNSNINNDINLLFISYCKERERENMLNLYYSKTKWVGCFGVASIVSLEFINMIFNKYDLENCIKNVKTKEHRESMERVLAILSFLEEPKLENNKSLFGNILCDYNNSFAYNYNNYINDINNINNNNKNYKMIKIWAGR